MKSTDIDERGNMYVPIFRDGIPMLIPFEGLNAGDEVMRESFGEEIAVGAGGVKHGQKTWFFHDPRWNAWFPSDFQQYQPIILFAGNLNTDGDIKEVNTVLANSNSETAMSELYKLGYYEDDLRELGFSFLFDVVKLKQL